MKTPSVTEGRQNLGAWLKRALHGEDVGFVVDGRVVALRRGRFTRMMTFCMNTASARSRP